MNYLTSYQFLIFLQRILTNSLFTICRFGQRVDNFIPPT